MNLTSLTIKKIKIAKTLYMRIDKGGFTGDQQPESEKETLPDLSPQQGVKITSGEISARRELLETHKVEEEEHRASLQREAEKMNREFEIAKKLAEDEWTQTVVETETRLTQGIERLKTMLPAFEGKLIGVAEEHYYFGRMPTGESVEHYQDGYRYAAENYFLGKNIGHEKGFGEGVGGLYFLGEYKSSDPDRDLLAICKKLAEPDTKDEDGRSWIRRNVPIFDDTVHILNGDGGTNKFKYFFGDREIASTEMSEVSDRIPGYRDPHGVDKIFGQRVTPEALHQFIQEAEKLAAEESRSKGREIEANRPLPEEIQKEI
jgi:hypothetical protein